MFLTNSGTASAIQTAVDSSAAQIASYLANYPASDKVGLAESNWADPNLLYAFQLAYNQSNYSYRI
jgi:hypothetical protein